MDHTGNSQNHQLNAVEDTHKTECAQIFKGLALLESQVLKLLFHLLLFGHFWVHPANEGTKLVLELLKQVKCDNWYECLVNHLAVGRESH